jgi:hypothetical protein
MSFPANRASLAAGLNRSVSDVDAALRPKPKIHHTHNARDEQIDNMPDLTIPRVEQELKVLRVQAAIRN